MAARPRSLAALHALDIPRFSRNNRNAYGEQIVATLKQARSLSLNPKL